MDASAAVIIISSIISSSRTNCISIFVITLSCYYVSLFSQHITFDALASFSRKPPMCNYSWLPKTPLLGGHWVPPTVHVLLPGRLWLPPSLAPIVLSLTGMHVRTSCDGIASYKYMRAGVFLPSASPINVGRKLFGHATEKLSTSLLWIPYASTRLLTSIWKQASVSIAHFVGKIKKKTPMSTKISTPFTFSKQRMQ